jgi:hypothetical protein
MKALRSSTVVRYISTCGLLIALICCQSRHEDPLTAGPALCSRVIPTPGKAKVIHRHRS